MNRVLIAVAAFVLGVAQAQDAERVDKPQIQAGDTWTYNRIDMWKREIEFVFEQAVTEVAAAGIKVNSVRKDKQTSSVQVYSDHWNLRERDRERWTPDYSWLQFPLQVGQKYRADHRYDNPDAGRASKVEREAMVVGWEDVVVPAGKFRALKIVTQGTYTRLDTSGSGTQKETLWYAPAVKRWVKTEYEDTDFRGRVFNRNAQELVDFKI